MILKRILSGGEVSRLHRDGEGYTFTDTREPHHYRPPAFSLAETGAKKKLGKKKRRQERFAVATARRRAPGSPARAFKKARPKLLKQAKTSAKHRRFCKRTEALTQNGRRLRVCHLLFIFPYSSSESSSFRATGSFISIASSSRIS